MRKPPAIQSNIISSENTVSDMDLTEQSTQGEGEGKGEDREAKGVGTKVTIKGDREPMGKAPKRTHSEVSEASLEEFSFIHQQLETLTVELKETRNSIKNLMSKDDIESFITKTVQGIMREMEGKLTKLVEMEVKERTVELNNRLDFMVYENGEIKDRLYKVEEELQKERETMHEALEKSNYNEQFSRKNNVKIMGIKDLEHETEASLTDKVISVLKEEAKVDIETSEIMAIHRIPSRHDPKPVLMKLKNNNVKTRLMKHRKIMKQQGHKLVDDVTKKNTELISRLLRHEKIESAWFFNGAIFGKTQEGRRYKFDLFSDVNKVINKKKDGE